MPPCSNFPQLISVRTTRYAQFFFTMVKSHGNDMWEGQIVFMLYVCTEYACSPTPPLPSPSLTPVHIPCPTCMHTCTHTSVSSLLWQDTFNKIVAPHDVLNFCEGDMVSKVRVQNPVFDHVPPDLITLFLTNM